jgi:ribosomal protein S16
VAVRLRLTRVGGKKDPIWRVVVADQRSPRDGRVIETIGHYNAQTDPSTLVIDEERARSWLARGCASRASTPPPAESSLQRAVTAMPSESAKQLLEYLAEGLVDDPDAVAVEQFEEDDGTVVLELCVGAEDYGRVIGRGGRTAHALRTVVKAAAAGEGSHVLVDIVD